MNAIDGKCVFPCAVLLGCRPTTSWTHCILKMVLRFIDSTPACNLYVRQHFSSIVEKTFLFFGLYFTNTHYKQNICPKSRWCKNGNSDKAGRTSTLPCVGKAAWGAKLASRRSFPLQTNVIRCPSVPGNGTDLQASGPHSLKSIFYSRPRGPVEDNTVRKYTDPFARYQPGVTIAVVNISASNCSWASSHCLRFEKKR